MPDRQQPPGYVGRDVAGARRPRTPSAVSHHPGHHRPGRPPPTPFVGSNGRRERGRLLPVEVDEALEGICTWCGGVAPGSALTDRPCCGAEECRRERSRDSVAVEGEGRAAVRRLFAACAGIHLGFTPGAAVSRRPALANTVPQGRMPGGGGRARGAQRCRGSPEFRRSRETWSAVVGVEVPRHFLSAALVAALLLGDDRLHPGIVRADHIEADGFLLGHGAGKFG